MSCFFIDRIDAYNREDVQNKYIDAIIAHMDFMEIRDALREYLDKEKSRYTHKHLYREIKKQSPEILREVFDNYVDTFLKQGDYHEEFKSHNRQ
jgi:hypothetical protein